MNTRVLPEACSGGERLGAGGAREGAFARVRPAVVVALHLPPLHMVWSWGKNYGNLVLDGDCCCEFMCLYVFFIIFVTFSLL